MQQESAGSRQAERSAAMRQRLLAAARALFAEKGYAATGTPELVAAAGVTRGALYHHFADKAELFRAVVEEEHVRVAEAVNASSGDVARDDAIGALLAGSDAFLEAMQEPGRRQILLVDAPAVLGRAALDAIDARHGLATLVEGLEAAMAAGAIRRDLPLLPAAHLLGALFDRAALAGPEAAPDYRAAMRMLIEGLRA
jgi:AcrR family transcriptional regulator